MTPDAFVQRLLNHYGAPEHATDMKMLGADYAAALKGTDADLLQAASDRLLKDHRFRCWPTVAECRAAVDKAALDRFNARRRVETHSATEHRMPTPEERERLAALVRETVAKLKAINAAAQPAKRTWIPTDRDAWGARYGKPPAGEAA